MGEWYLMCKETVLAAKSVLTSAKNDAALDSEAFIDQLEEYSACLQRCTAAIPEAMSAEEEEIARELQALNERVASVAREATAASSAALQSHQQRGRSLMKYIDQLPRQLGSSRVKKG